ncbi:hypothetical protein PVK06_043202 [Gossypium arboreum]|uniref:Uncharacterized protein n=1 Tax=Gossypium arboreum TaxID=29729 RepID=A0ABR0MPK7_GOSAR|nr:hypothetical protein PVK06_043202 [Gossypium arboreum]
MHDVPHLDPEDPHIIVNHPGLDNSSQQEFAIGDHGDELNIVKAVSDPIHEETDIIVDVTTNMEFKPILNESVEEPINFLAIAENVLAEEVDEFNSFSSNKGNKARVTKTSRDMEGRKLEVIIP